MSERRPPLKCSPARGDKMTADKAAYLIIGGSAAGMSAAQVIREQDPNGIVTVLSEEPDMPYFRPLIPYVVTGKKKAEGIGLQGNGPYTHAGINILTGARVESVDISRKTVYIKGGAE